MPEDRMKSRFSPFQSINEPRHRAILRQGFVHFVGIVAFYSAIIVKLLGYLFNQLSFYYWYL